MVENKSEDYEYLRFLGEGSFGKVDLYLSKKENQKVVIKKIDSAKIKQDKIDMIKEEVQIMKQLDHPNIIKIKETFNDNTTLNIVMEYAESNDLAVEISKKVAFSEETILKWFLQISLAIKQIHTLKIIHRDLKPANVFLDKDLNIKLGDFGVSKQLEETSALASTKIGTPYYMAPEVFGSNPYDQKSDIWSMGVILYELCTFNHPFEGNNIMVVCKSIAEGNFAPIENYSCKIRKLVNRLLTKDPKKRPDIDEVLNLISERNIIKKTYENGDIYEGEIEFNKKNGFGIYISKDGERFEGYWKDDKRENGFGVFYSKNGYKYEGEWVDEKKNGIGIYHSNLGDIYEAECKDDRLHGYGTCFFRNGSKYEGQFRRNRKNGYGIFSWKNGNAYEGQFIFGNMNGYGVYIDKKNDERYEGEMNDDIKNGYGINFYNNGDQYEGEFRYQKANGYGKLKDKNGNLNEGKFENDQFIQTTSG